MEKISGIVRGNPRVTAVDNKNAAPSRTGMPTFGRPAGESTPAVAKSSSTASRAVALHKGMTEAKKAVSQGRVISQMADEFFMSKTRPTEIPIDQMLPVPKLETGAIDTGKTEIAATELAENEAEMLETPARGYTPRGSFIDVRA